jgi:hypothetical protein
MIRVTGVFLVSVEMIEVGVEKRRNAFHDGLHGCHHPSAALVSK